jgi:hypothetical protein
MAKAELRKAAHRLFGIWMTKRSELALRWDKISNRNCPRPGVLVDLLTFRWDSARSSQYVFKVSQWAEAPKRSLTEILYKHWTGISTTSREAYAALFRFCVCGALIMFPNSFTMRMVDFVYASLLQILIKFGDISNGWIFIAQHTYMGRYQLSWCQSVTSVIS